MAKKPAKLKPLPLPGQGYMYSGSPASAAKRAAFYPRAVAPIPSTKKSPQGYFYSGTPASMVRRAVDYRAIPHVSPTHLPVVVKPPSVGGSVDPTDTPPMFAPPDYGDLPTHRFVDPSAIWSQASGLVSGMINPLMQALASRQASTEQDLSTAGQAHSDALAAALTQSAQPVAQAYQNATQQAAATADAASNSFQGQGGETTRDLASKLAQIGGPVPGADQLAQTYRGADQAGYTRNSLDVQGLINQGANANAYLAKQPGIARLVANQDLQSALAQARAGFMDAGTQLTTDATQRAGEAFNMLSDARQKPLDAQFERDVNAFNLKRDDASSAASAAQDQRDFDYKSAQDQRDFNYTRGQDARDYNLKLAEDRTTSNQAVRDYRLKAATAQVNALQHDQDQYQKRILTLQALRTASNDKAAQRAYDLQINQAKIAATANQKALDRATREAMLNATIGARVGIANAGNQTRTNIAAAGQAGQNARTQAQIDAAATAQAKRIAANKKAAAVKAAQNKAGTGADSWQTPGSSKRNRVIGSVAGNILVQGKGGTRTIRGTLVDPNNVKNVDTAIWNKVNASIRAQGINPETPAGKELRREIYHTYIEGARAPDGSYYHIPANWAIAKP